MDINLKSTTSPVKLATMIRAQSLAETHPVLAAEAFEWDPSQFTRGSGQKLSWKCSRGHVYIAAIYSRTAGSGCPVCAGRKVLQGFNDLATCFPEIAHEALGWDPSLVAFGTHAKKDWQCPVGHEYNSSVVKRTASHSGCPYCSSNQILIGFNDLASQNPEVAAEAHDWDPQSLSSRSGLRRQWKCPEGHIYSMRVADRTDLRKPDAPA